MKILSKSFCRRVRNILFKAVNKEFLVFLFFLAISGAFWFVLAVKEPMEKEIAIPVVVTNIPKNLILTDDTFDTLKVTIRDEGYTLLYYQFNKRPPIKINFNSYFKGDGHSVISSSEVLKMVKARLEKSSQVLSVKPDKIDIFYSSGENKVVPVEINGKFTADEMSFLTQKEVTPDSVTVYATKEQLDMITSVRTEYVIMSDISDVAQRKVRLERVRGVKCVPNVVTVKVNADVSSEGSVEVPVSVVGVPEGKVLRTYPSRASVKFVTGSKMLKQIDPADFRVEADYTEIVNNPQQRFLHLRLVEAPPSVNNAKTVISQVDYLLEQDGETSQQ